MDIIFTLLEFAVKVFLWYLFFNFVFGLIFGSNKVRQAEQAAALTKKLDEIVHRVNIEQHGTVYYWFDADDDEFLGQGTNTDEIIAHVKSRFPTHLFFLPTQELVNAPEWTPKPYSLPKA
jgi:hypothetical protein